MVYGTSYTHAGNANSMRCFSPFNPSYNHQFGLYDELCFDGAWLNPKMYIRHENRKEFSPRKIFQDIYTEEYKVKERNEREITIGKIKLKNALIVNPKNKTGFDAFYCEMDYENETYPIILSEKEFKKRNVLQQLSFFRRNPDCTDKHIVAAFFLAVQDMTDIKFLQTPIRSGWEETTDGKLIFVSSECVYPYLATYYPSDVKNRKLLVTDRALRDIAKEYAEALPNVWQCKLLVAIRLASIMLYFFEKEGIKPDQLYVVETASESATKEDISLLKTQNYESLVVLSLTSKKIDVQNAINNANDGNIIIRDNSYVEEWKIRNNRLYDLIDNLYNSNGEENGSRHLITIVTETPGNLPSEMPAMYVNMSECMFIGDPDKLQHLSGEFDSALIRTIVCDPKNMSSLINKAIAFSKIESKTVNNSENVNSKRVIRGALYIMQEYDLISSNETSEIIKWLKRGGEPSMNSSTAIVNDFSSVLNHLLFESIKVVSQHGKPYYEIGKGMAFEAKEYINFEAEVFKKILYHMKKTQKRQKLLHALNECGKLYSNNNFKRNLEVEIGPGETASVSVYSISKSLLNDTNREHLEELKYYEYFIDSQYGYKKGFIPLITNNTGTKTAGLVLLPGMDVNANQYAVGISRSGKTTYLISQAFSRVLNGDTVIIIDHSGAFSRSKLEDVLTPEIVRDYCSFWNVYKHGLPIGLTNFDYCDAFLDKKQSVFCVLAAAARELGDVQAKVLRKKISAALKKMSGNSDEKLDINAIIDTLDENDDIEKSLRNKLEEVFEDFEDLPQSCRSWSEFLSTQKRIVVISTGIDSTAKGSHITDVLLASLYTYKQNVPETRYTIVLDECQDLYLDTDGPVDIMLRKGSKSGMRMLLASQEYSASRDKLGKIIGNCETLVFFKPKGDNISDIAKLTGVDKSTLAELDQGQCVVYGLFYNKYENKNKSLPIIGRTYIHHK